MLIDEYRRFKELKKKYNIFYVFYKSIKYLFRFSIITIFYKIYNTIIFFIFKKYYKKNLDNIKNNNTNNLNLLFHQFNSDKSFEYKNENLDTLPGHNYDNFYIENLYHLKDKRINILELGVLNGGSTAGFYFYFSKADIYCIDINYNNFLYKSKRIKFFEINLRDRAKILNFVNKNLNFFDIIIDDASHLKSCILENVENFLPSLKHNGVYIIEDYKFPEIYESKNDLKNEINISNLLENINNKIIFKSNIITKKTTDKLFNNKKILTYKGSRKDSDIAFIHF